jgi:ABC-type nitrate/sulfonate/bicarbonate transport system substrate-binding protein
VVQKGFKGVKPTMTLAYSTAGSGTHITALRFMKEYGFEAQLVKTGTVPATFTQVMSGQVDIGFSTPPVGLEAAEEGKIRIIALANDLASIRTQTVRVTIANSYDLAKRPAVYARFIQAYRETIDWMYSDDAAINAFANWAGITPIKARRVRDRSIEPQGHHPGRDCLQVYRPATLRRANRPAAPAARRSRALMLGASGGRSRGGLRSWCRSALTRLSRRPRRHRH